jgi:hypothetical protein
MCSKLIILVLLVSIIYTLYLISNKSNVKEGFPFSESRAVELQDNPTLQCRLDLSDRSFYKNDGKCYTYDKDISINYDYCEEDSITNQVGDIIKVHAYQSCSECGVCPLPTTTSFNNQPPAPITTTILGNNNPPPAPTTTSFNNPTTTSFNNPITTSFNNPITTSFNYQPTTSFNYQPTTTSLNTPPPAPTTTSFNNPITTSFNNPITTSLNTPPPAHTTTSFNYQPTTTSFNNPITTSLNTPPPAHTTSFNYQPTTTSFNSSVVGSSPQFQNELQNISNKVNMIDQNISFYDNTIKKQQKIINNISNQV